MATKEEYVKWLIENQDQRDSGEFRTVARAYRRQFGERTPRTMTPPSLLEAKRRKGTKVVDFPTYFMGTKSGRFFQGAADFPIGAVQLLANATGIGAESINEFVRKREESISAGREATGSEGFDFSRLAGNLLASAPAAALKVPVTLAGRAAQGAALGAGYGAVTPVTGEDFAAEKISQVALGTALGGAIPSVTAGVRRIGAAARNLVDPFLPGGVDRSLRRAISESVEELPPVVKELRAGGTTQQAISRTREPRLAALVEGAKGRAAKETAKTLSAENLARIEAIRQAGGAVKGETLEEVISLSTKARTKATKALYQEAERVTDPVNAIPTIRLVERLIRLDPRNTGLNRVLGEVRKSLLEEYPSTVRGLNAWKTIRKGIDRHKTAPESLVEARRITNQIKNGLLDPYEGAQLLGNLKPTTKTASDAIASARYSLEVGEWVVSEKPRILISAYRNIGTLFKDPQTGKALPENIARNLSLVRRSLERQIEKTVPKFKEANNLYRELSVPVNRAQIARRLEQRLSPTLAGEEGSVIQQRATQFGAALKDETKLIKQATGFARGSGLNKYFDAEQLAKLQNVAKRLEEDAEFKSLVTLGREGARRVIDEMSPDTLINPLQRVIMVINGILRRAGTSRQEATLDRAAEVIQNPQEFATLLEKATPLERANIKSFIDSPQFTAALIITAEQ